MYAQIDYLQFTVSKEPAPAHWGTGHRISSPVRNYSRGIRYENGALVSSGHPNSDKYHVVLSGKALAAMAEEMSTIEYIKTLLESTDATFSRVDVAITVTGDDASFVTVSEVASWVRQGLCSGSHYERGGAKSINDADKNNVETLYIGDINKRGKRGIFRVYDKGLESGGVGNFVTRFELEEKRERAHTSVRRIADGASLGSVINTRVQFDTDEWRSIVGSETACQRYAQSDENQTLDERQRRWRWLRETVATSLGKAVADDMVQRQGDITELIEFQEAVDRAYRARVAELTRGAE